MWKNTSLKSKTSPVRYRTTDLRARNTGQESLTDRQEKVPGFNLAAFSAAKIIMGGGGGVGSEVGEALVRKGVGTLVILDHDVVEPTNLLRQFFHERDLNKPKAHRLAKNLAREGFCGTVIEGYALRLEEAMAQGIDLSGSVAVVGVDTARGRIAASRFFRSKSMPVIFTAVSETANNGYVFVQEAALDAPCFACLFPDAINDATDPCPGTPAIKDILKVVAGIVVYVVDTLLPGMARPRGWNYKEIFLDGFPGWDWTVERRKDCQLCGTGG